MTAREALEWGFIDGIPEDREELLEHFLGVAPDQLWIVKRSWSEELVNFLESIQFLLLIAGLLLLFIEFQMPGFGLPGILGLSCLGILFFNKYLAGLAEITEILMVIAGVGLLAVEIFVMPGTFVAGVLGGILILAGLILSFQPFIIPDAPWETDLLLDNIVYMSGSLVIVVIASAMMTKFLPRTPGLRWLVLEARSAPGTLHGSAGTIDDVQPEIELSVGDTGVARSDLRPAGKVLISGLVVDAQSEGGFIDTDEAVEIVRRTGNFIIVRKHKGGLT
jgi:membrane-bound serine protease (ClpP class)